MGYAVIAFLVSACWLITGFNYFKNEERGMAPFIVWVLVPGVPVFLASVITMIILHFRG